MPDDTRPDRDQSLSSSNVPMVPEGERRREQDRRQAGRQGKYDRRKNRCVHCAHFAESDEGKGECKFHHTTVVAYAFACPFFESIPTEPPKPNRD